MDLERTLYKENGEYRQGVLCVLRKSDNNEKVKVETTNDEGKVVFEDVDYLDTGIYQLEYYGDGIKPTEFDRNGNKVQEDPVTPWEYNIEITNIGVEFDKTPPDFSMLPSVELE